MKSFYCFVFAVVCTFSASAQLFLHDSLIQVLQSKKEDTSRVLVLAQLSRLFLYETPLKGIPYAMEGLQIATNINYQKGIGVSLNALGSCHRMTGNYAHAIKLHFDALEIFDKLHDPEGLANSYHGISTVYEDQSSAKEAIEYAHKVIQNASLIGNDGQLMRIQSNMGRSFQHMNMLDSALIYVQNAHEIAIKLKDSSILGGILGRLGNINHALKNEELALAYYRLGIQVASSKNNNNSLEELYNSLSQRFNERGLYDSSIHYARLAFNTSTKLSNPTPLIRSSLLLTNNFKIINRLDSAFKYQSIAMATKDTVLTAEKIKQQQFLSFQEKERQAQKITLEKKAKAERRQTLEFSFVGIGIFTILIVFLLMSRSVIVSSRTITYFGIIALLLTFEFINLLIHPFLAGITHHSPALMLIALACVAAILVPIHHSLQKWITNQLIEKNKRIRLDAAKKTIAMLESRDPAG